MKCEHCGSKTPKRVELGKPKANINTDNLECCGTITIDGYIVSADKPIYQCKNKSCKYAFNVDE